MTGAAKEGCEEVAAMGFPVMNPEELKDLPVEMRQIVEQQMRSMVLQKFSQIKVVRSEYVGDEFHFELGGLSPEIPGMKVSEVSAPIF